MTAATSVQAAVEALVQRQLDDGRQLGLQVAAYLHGELVVDISAGVMGPRDPRPVHPDTLFTSFSTTKGVASAALHLLADRGLVDYDLPVAHYWPEFGAHGKDRVTVAQAMAHMAAIHEAPNPLTAAFVTDWEGGLRYVADAVPAWEPGTATGYHALTWSWVAGGIIQHASGRHIKEVLEDDIARPLGISGEMYIGIPDGVEERLATLKAAPGGRSGTETPGPVNPELLKSMPPRMEFTYHQLEIRRACLPASNGHFTARALARLYGALANGGEIDGVRLVSPERIPHMYRLVTDAEDRVLGGHPRKGIGFWLGDPVGNDTLPFGRRPTAFGHKGNGGSVGFADPETGLGVGITINLMQPLLHQDGPTVEICDLIRSELGIP